MSLKNDLRLINELLITTQIKGLCLSPKKRMRCKTMSKKIGIVDCQEAVNVKTKDNTLRMMLPKIIYGLKTRKEQNDFISKIK